MSLPPPLFRCFLFPGYWFPPVREVTRSSIYLKACAKKVIKQVNWPYVSFYLPLMLNETSLASAVIIGVNKTRYSF